MPKFRKKPVVIEAVQWTGDRSSVFDIGKFMKNCRSYTIVGGKVTIHAPGGDLTASVGDWIIKRTKGEFYLCKPEIFEQTYEPVNEGGQ